MKLRVCLVLILSICAVVIAGCASTMGDHAATAAPQPVSFADQQPGGELAKRLRANFDRLEDDKWHPENVFKSQSENSWPGDFEGRTVLGLTLLARATGRQPEHLEKLIDMYPENMNEQGFFGEPPAEGTADEQQLSGHGWVLRGLCEYYLWKQDPEALKMIRHILKNLALPMRGMYEKYPTASEKRRKIKGEAIGTEEATLGGWTLSSDHGCAFIFMDGVMQAYTLLDEGPLKTRTGGLIEEMVDRFLEIELETIGAQTHSTLTGLRGLCRWYSVTGDPRLLEAIEKRFRLYKKEGMSDNYENFNWFGRPAHSEPCAIFDSFMVAVKLWRFTGNPQYLEDAHHIYFNAISATQRANGGFGCNTCVRTEFPYLEVDIPEAYWCCTMRAGEGLSRAAEYAYFTAGEGIYVTFFADNRATLRTDAGSVTVEQSTPYPFEGGTTLRVTDADLDGPVELRVFAPDFTTLNDMTVNGQAAEFSTSRGFVTLRRRLEAGDVVKVSFEQEKRVIEPITDPADTPYRSVRFGPLVLSTPKKESELTLPPNGKLRRDGARSFLFDDVRMAPIYHLPAELEPRQALFEVEEE